MASRTPVLSQSCASPGQFSSAEGLQSHKQRGPFLLDPRKVKKQQGSKERQCPLKFCIPRNRLSTARNGKHMKGGVLSGLDNRPGKVIASAAIQRIKKNAWKTPSSGNQDRHDHPRHSHAHALPLLRGRGGEITAGVSVVICTEYRCSSCRVRKNKL